MNACIKLRAISLIALVGIVVGFACTDRRSNAVQPAGDKKVGDKTPADKKPVDKKPADEKDNDGPPFSLGISYTPTPPVGTDPNPKIVLRPSMVPQPVYLFLKNNLEVDRENCKIRVEDGKTGRVLFTGVLPTLAPNKSVRLKLAAAGSALPPKGAKDGKEAKGPAPWPTLAAPDFRLRVVIDDGKGKGAVPFDVPVQFQDPTVYTDATAEIRKVKDKHHLRVTVKSKNPPQVPIPVALELDPALITGLVSQKTGTLQAELEPERDTVRLYTDADSFSGFGRVSVAVDGFARAFAFSGRLDTKTEDVGLPKQPRTTPRLRIIMPRYHAATPLLRVPLQVDALLETDRDLRVEVALDDADDAGTSRFVTGPLLPNFREQLVQAGTDDEGRLLFKVAVQDWAPALKTESVFGARRVRVRLLKKGLPVALEKEIGIVENTKLFQADPSNLNAVLDYEMREKEVIGLFADIVIDGSQPAVTFRPTPKTVFPGAEFRPEVKIPRAADQAPVERVDFYLGDPLKDTEPLPKGAVPGIWDAKANSWIAAKPFIVPAIDKGPLVVNARAETVVKLKGSAEPATIRIVEQKPKYATIAGKILRGDLGQPKTKVYLLDAKGVVKTDTESEKSGSYKFENVKPGDYYVYAAQPALKLSGSAKVAVPEDKNAKIDPVDIKLLTQSK
jgi:hypothetical protein